MNFLVQTLLFVWQAILTQDCGVGVDYRAEEELPDGYLVVVALVGAGNSMSRPSEEKQLATYKW